MNGNLLVTEKLLEIVVIMVLVGGLVGLLYYPLHLYKFGALLGGVSDDF
jgi:hypothetical protein